MAYQQITRDWTRNANGTARSTVILGFLDRERVGLGGRTEDVVVNVTAVAMLGDRRQRRGQESGCLPCGRRERAGHGGAAEHLRKGLAGAAVGQELAVPQQWRASLAADRGRDIRKPQTTRSIAQRPSNVCRTKGNSVAAHPETSY
jgi:hypothetical protein